MHELVDDSVDHFIIEFSVPVQRERNVRIENAQKRSGIGTLAAFHVAVVFCSVNEQGLHQLLLAVIERCTGLEGVGLRGGEPHRQVEAVQARVLAGKAEISFRQRAQGHGHITLIIGRLLDLRKERVERLCEQGDQQPVLAAKIMVEGGFLDAGRVGDLLHAYGIIAARREQLQGLFFQVLAVIHTVFSVPFGTQSVKQSDGTIYAV